MMFQVEITFKAGTPAFSTQVDANSEKAAIDEGKRIAKQFGFDKPVKSTKAYLITETQ
jgi:hypothetical protein